MRLPLGRWIEIIGLLPATLLMTPVIGSALIGALLVLVAAVLTGGHFAENRIGAGRTSVLLILPLASGLAGLIAAWIVAIAGADRVVRSGRHKAAAQLALVSGTGAGLWWVRWVWNAAKTKSNVADIYWTLPVLAAVAVAIHQLYTLIRTKTSIGI